MCLGLRWRHLPSGVWELRVLTTGEKSNAAVCCLHYKVDLPRARGANMKELQVNSCVVSKKCIKNFEFMTSCWYLVILAECLLGSMDGVSPKSLPCSPGEILSLLSAILPSYEGNTDSNPKISVQPCQWSCYSNVHINKTCSTLGREPAEENNQCRDPCSHTSRWFHHSPAVARSCESHVRWWLEGSH